MKRAVIAAFAAGLAMAGGAQAAVIIVDAKANSSTGGTGAVTGLTLALGQIFTVTVDPGDLWNAGTPPRWSNADGLTKDLFATGSDDSGAAAGTLIGIQYGSRTVGSFTAPYGALVGEIGGVFHLLGTNFTGQAWNSGDLNLVYWDENTVDNTQYITANVTTAVPEPATWAFMIVGFGLLGGALRTRRSAKVLAA